MARKHCIGRNAKHGLGPKSFWTVEVDVYLEVASDPPQFSIESCLPVNGNGELVFHNRGRHGFEILFHLHDLTQSGYQFPGPPNVKDALWSAPGSACPPDNCNSQWPEFTSVRVTDNGMTLVVRNLNDTPGQFGYTLRVTNDGGGSYLSLDPIGDNENGNYAMAF